MLISLPASTNWDKLQMNQSVKMSTVLKCVCQFIYEMSKWFMLPTQIDNYFTISVLDRIKDL